MLFKVWIRCYCYNNKFVLHLKRNMRRWSNVLLLLCSPYLLLRWACLAVYECFIGKRLVNRELCEDRKRNFKYEMAVVCISKNEGPYIREWIEFHRIVGISKFYFYDNESDDDTSDVLAPYIADGIVDYILIKGKGVQLDAYNQAIEKHKEECRYMAFRSERSVPGWKWYISMYWCSVRYLYRRLFLFPFPRRYMEFLLTHLFQ